MARQIKNAKLLITCDAAGAPQSAVVEYEVWDGNASKKAAYEVENPNWGKVLHNTGAVGEFWRDEFDAVKRLEVVS